MAIDGKLTWSIFPRLGIKLDKVTLTAPQPAQPVITLKEVKISGELAQLWRNHDQWEGRVSMDALNWDKVHLENARAKIEWQANTLSIPSLTASLYEGELKATLKAANLNQTPAINGTLFLTNVQLQPLLMDLHAASQLSLSGQTDVAITVQGQGSTKETLLKTLTGNAQINVKKGALHGIDLNYFVEIATALINKQPVKAPPEVKQTQFDSFAATFNITNGLTNTNDMLLAAPTFVTHGQGGINLPSETLNLHLQVQSQQAASLEWQIPIAVTGTFNHPNVQLDMTEIQKIITKKELDRLKSKANDIIKKHVPGKAGQFLQKLIQ